MIRLVVKAQLTEGESKDYSYEFDQPVVTIGRLKENDVQLPLSTVSGFHAQILKEGENRYLVDRGSINGTYLNGQRLVGGEKKLLQDGDVIRIQSFELYLSLGLAIRTVDQGATVMVARQMVMEVLGSWESKAQEKPRIIIMGGPDNGNQFELSEGKLIPIGRSTENEIVIEHPSISRRHAEITFNWSGAFVNDKNSANGVYVNDQRISGSQKLHDRDEIRLGQTNSPEPIVLVFSNPAEALLSKLEEKITEGPAAVEPQRITETATQGGVSPPAPETPVEPDAAQPEVQEPYTPVLPAAELPAKRSSSSVPLVAVGVLVVAAVAAVVLYIFTSSKEKPLVGHLEQESGTVGDIISISGEKFDGSRVKKVLIDQRNAPIIKSETNRIQVKIPEFPNVDALETKTEILLEGEKAILAQFPFTLVMPIRIKSISPESGKKGSEVRIRTNGGASRSAVYFGSEKAAVRTATETEIVASVPSFPSPIPPEGFSFPVTIKINEKPGKNSVNFLLLPEESTTFQLAFFAKPSKQGLNEYAVETSIGSLFLLVAKDEYGSNRERAEAVAVNLNLAVEIFRKTPQAKITLLREENSFSLFAEEGSPDGRTLLVRVFPEDAEPYGRINQRSIEVEELAAWWQLLLEAYYQVFVRVQNPENTGISASGGEVFQQIYDAYAVDGGQGTKSFRPDLLRTIPPEEKAKLVSVSHILPAKIARVNGKWTGIMSNILYPKIPDSTLELLLTLRQKDDGAISGTAELNWKIIMGQSFAYKKLGTFMLSGSYKRGEKVPLEFSFVEKDLHRLNFVGKLEGDILLGNFVVASTDEEGTWSVRLQH